MMEEEITSGAIATQLAVCALGALAIMPKVYSNAKVIVAHCCKY